MRAFSRRRDSDALIEAMSKTTMTMAPMEQAVTATPAMTSAFFASTGGGLVTFSSSATTNNNNNTIDRSRDTWPFESVIDRFLSGAGPQDRVHFRRQPRAQLSFPAHFDHYSVL